MYPELRIEDLAQLYSLHKRVDGLKVLLQVFKSYVRVSLVRFFHL